MASPIIPALAATAAAILFAGILTMTNAQMQDGASRLEMIANETAFEYVNVMDSNNGLALSHIWSEVSTIPAGESRIISVSCADGDYPSGGGFALGSADLQVTSSYAYSNQTSRGWTATIINTNATESLPAIVDVLCLTEAGTTTPVPSVEPPEPSNSSDSDEATVEITADTDWSGSIMDSESRSSTVEGSGDDSITLACEDDGFYSVFMQKQDEDGTLTVSVVKDDEVLNESTTTADYGVASISGEC